MRFYLSLGRYWTGTQADAKAAQGGTNDYETVEVPDAKAERLAWLNEQWAGFHDKLEALRTVPPLVEITVPEPTPDEVAKHAAVPIADLPPARTRARPAPAPVEPSKSVVEQIEGLDGRELLDALTAALSRMHEVLPDGWRQLARRDAAWGGGGCVSLSRGLGMMVLAGLAGAADTQGDERPDYRRTKDCRVMPELSGDVKPTSRCITHCCALTDCPVQPVATREKEGDTHG